MPRRMVEVDDLEDDADELVADDLAPNGHGPKPMGASLSDFEAAERETTLRCDLADGRVFKLWVRYDPNLLNDGTGTQVQELADGGDNLAAARMLCTLIEDWNMLGAVTALLPERDEDGGLVYDDGDNPVIKRRTLVKAGEPVPLDPETVQYIRSEIIVAIWTALRTDAMGLPPTATNRAERRRQQSRRSRSR